MALTEKAKGYGYKHISFILDRGYFSKENIRFMDKEGFDFVIMMKGMKETAARMIRSVKGTFEEDRAKSIRTYHTYGETVTGKLYGSDCIFRKNCASVPEERSAIPLQTEQSSAG